MAKFFLSVFEGFDSPHLFKSVAWTGVLFRYDFIKVQVAYLTFELVEEQSLFIDNDL